VEPVAVSPFTEIFFSVPGTSQQHTNSGTSLRIVHVLLVNNQLTYHFNIDKLGTITGFVLLDQFNIVDKNL
jgi:hypothetical protein